MVGNLFLEVIRAFYSYCRDALGSDLKLSYTQSGNSLTRYGFGLQLRTSSSLRDAVHLTSLVCVIKCMGLEKVDTQGTVPLVRITVLKSVTVNGLFPVEYGEEFKRHWSWSPPSLGCTTIFTERVEKLL